MVKKSQGKEKKELVPFISAELIRFDNRKLKDKDLENIPTYIRNILSDGISIHTEGKISGQIFSAKYPTYNTISGDLPKNKYIIFKFPQQGIQYFERILGETGPKFAINYENEDIENPYGDRFEELIQITMEPNPKGRYVIEGDNIDKGDLDKLQEISNYFKPTILSFFNLFLKNKKRLSNIEKKGTIESLVVPKTNTRK